jgi:hypothetical protein
MGSEGRSMRCADRLGFTDEVFTTFSLPGLLSRCQGHQSVLSQFLYLNGYSSSSTVGRDEAHWNGSKSCCWCGYWLVKVEALF